MSNINQWRGSIEPARTYTIQEQLGIVNQLRLHQWRAVNDIISAPDKVGYGSKNDEGDK